MMPWRIKFLRAAEKTGRFHGLKVVRVVVVQSNRGEHRVLGIDLRTVAWTVAGLVLAAWLGGALTLSAWFGRNPYNRITTADLLLPWRWSELRVLRAQTYLAQGRDDLKAGRYADGMFRIRAGLRQQPNEEGARLELAAVYCEFGRWSDAKELLLPQLAWSPSQGFLQNLFEQAARFDDLGTIRSTCEHLLERGGMEDVVRAWVREQRLQVLFRLRQFEEVVAVTDDPANAATWVAKELRAVALCQLHRGAEAVAYVEGLVGAPEQRARRDELLAGAYREAGRLEEMAGVLSRLVNEGSHEPDRWLFAVVQWAKAGKAEDAERELRRYLQRFEADDQRVRVAAWRCASIPAPSLVALCLASVRERGRPWEDVQFEQALAHLRSGDAAGFAESMVALHAAAPKAPGATRHPLLDWADAVTEALGRSGPESHQRLAELMRGRAPMPLFRDTLGALEKRERWADVEAVAVAGLQQFRASVELEERRALAAKRGSTLGAVANAEEFWALLDGCGQRGEWDSAARLIAEVRRAGPPWAKDGEAELDWREARVAFEQGQSAQVRRLIATRLARRAVEVERAEVFVRDYAARGDLAAARMLGETMAAAVPDSALAAQWMAELMPKAPSTASRTPAR